MKATTDSAEEACIVNALKVHRKRDPETAWQASFEVGLVEGFKVGLSRGMEKVALSLLKTGQVSIELLSRSTGLSVTRLAELMEKS